MEIVLALIALAVIGSLIYVNREAKGFDVNRDGKVDLADAKEAVENTVAAAKDLADVNKDGVVDAADAKVIVEKAKTQVKKATSNPKTAAKKATSRGRRPKAQ